MPRGVKRSFEERVAATLEKVMKSLQRKLQKELQQQGHVNTGRLLNSITYTVDQQAGKVVAEMTALNYGMIIEVGVPGNRIPFSGKKGTGGTSKYIQGLVRFFQSKGLGERQSLRAAFATAYVQKREGMPTLGSYGYSRNGERKNWIRNTLTNNLEQIGNLLKKEVGVELTLQFAETLEFEPLKFSV